MGQCKGLSLVWNSVVRLGLVAGAAIIGSQVAPSPAQAQSSPPAASHGPIRCRGSRACAPAAARDARAAGAAGRDANRGADAGAVVAGCIARRRARDRSRGTGYVATQSVTGTKTDTPILETPQSISVVTRDQMVAQQTQDIGEALRSHAGVSLDLYSATTFFDAVKLRGFDAPRYLDGLRLPLDPGTQFAYPRVEPYGLERLEVLRGPSSGLYGQTEPGGLINMVSKRPLWFPHYSVEGTFGSSRPRRGRSSTSSYGTRMRTTRFSCRSANPSTSIPRPIVSSASMRIPRTISIRRISPAASPTSCSSCTSTCLPACPENCSSA